MRLRTCQVIYFGSRVCNHPALFEVETKLRYSPSQKFAVCDKHRQYYEDKGPEWNMTIEVTEIEPHI